MGTGWGQAFYLLLCETRAGSSLVKERESQKECGDRDPQSRMVYALESDCPLCTVLDRLGIYDR